VSIAGFDNIPVTAQVWPQLSTTQQPVREMSERAAEILIRRIEDGQLESDIEHVTIKSSLVFRVSISRR